MMKRTTKQYPQTKNANRTAMSTGDLTGLFLGKEDLGEAIESRAGY